MLVSASILSDTLIPSSIVKELNKSKVDFIHLDIMDGKFVDNKTWTYGEIKKIIKDTNKSLDVHLMVENPSKYISDYALLNTEYLTVHYEITKNLEQIIDEIKSYGFNLIGSLAVKGSPSKEDVETIKKLGKEITK